MTETRAEKAQRLVDEGRVRITDRQTYFATAHVGGDPKWYESILFDNGHFHCTCSWGRYQSYTRDLCAHALALRLAVERGEG